jgi:hypothetical protein
MTQSKDVFFGPYLPDLGGGPSRQIPGYLVDALGVQPMAEGYRGLPSLETIGATAPASNFDAVAYFPYGSGKALFAVDATGSKVYQSGDFGATWSDVSPASGAFGQDTEFALYNDRVVVVSASHAPGTKLLSNSVGADLADLSGAPTARHVGRVRDHIVLGNLVGSAVEDSATVRWCAIGDPTDWPTPGTADALAKQSDAETLDVELGTVQRILGGEKFGVIAQQRGLTRMTYVGGNVVYEFDTYERQVGAGEVGSTGQPVPFVSIGPSQWVWLNEHGVFWTNGYTVERLSAGSIEMALFLDKLDHPSGPLLRPNAGAFDQRRNQVIFTTRGGSSTNQHLIFNIATRRFTFAEMSATPLLFDGPQDYNVQTNHVYAVNSSDRLIRRWSGTSGVTATIQTAFIELEPGFECNLEAVQVLGANQPDPTVSYKGLNALATDMLSQSGFTAMTAAPRGSKKTARAAAAMFAFRLSGAMTESHELKGLRIYYTRGVPAVG